MHNTEVFVGICQACSFFPILGIMVVFKVQTWEMVCPVLLRQIRPTALPQRAYILPQIEELHAGFCTRLFGHGTPKEEETSSNYADSYVTNEPKVSLASLTVTACKSLSVFLGP